MDKTKKLVLVDDHVIIRNGLKELIEKIGPYKIIHEFNSGLDYSAALPFETEPDLIILDLNMPEMDGFEIVEMMKYRAIKTPILILTLESDENTIIQLFRKGVRGFLKKDCSAENLKTALQSIFQFGYHHNEFLTLSLQNEMPQPEKSEADLILDQLTEREREFLKYVCHDKEYTYDQIASLMFVQPRTVDGYRESLFNKFEIKSKTGLVLFVLKYRLIDKL